MKSLAMGGYRNFSSSRSLLHIVDDKGRICKLLWIRKSLLAYIQLWVYPTPLHPPLCFCMNELSCRAMSNGMPIYALSQ